MLFRPNKRTNIPVAVFDISSSSVAGAHAIAHRTIEAPMTILASSRVDAPLMEDLDMKRFVDTTIHNIDSVAQKLRMADVHAPKHLQLVLASPWYISQTRTIVYKKEEQFVCNHKLLNAIVDEEIQHIIENELEKFGGFGKEGTVVEKQISLVKLNGYVTGDPYGKKAKTIELFLTITVAPKKIIDRFIDTLKRSYGNVPVHITTSPYATFVVARDYFDAAKECMISDVGEEVTDVAFVKDGLFLYQHSFPSGSYGLYRALMDENKHSAAEAEVLVETYRLGKVSTAVKARIEKAIGVFSERWREGLQGILDQGHYGFCLPELCYITADPRLAGVYPAIVSTDPFIQHACSRGSVHAVFLGDEQLKAHVNSLDEGVDVPLATAALFVGRII
jgi:cell division ATPase FtsA